MSNDLKTLECIKIIGGKKLRQIISDLSSFLPYAPTQLTPREGKSLRRITWFPGMETKVRVVGILDYWSQAALRPLHDYLFSALRRIPQDATFNQGKFVEFAKGWPVYYSFDLSAATDRFPMIVIEQLLRVHLPDWYVEAWSHLMIGIPFDYQQDKSSPKEKICYSVGQPMGAYSSWNSFALCHHYVMYWCCKELNIPWRSAKYVILGDDVLIGDQRLAIKYKDTITLLGVDISDIKSHVSPKLYEFAKRLVFNGVEITPFPFSAIKESSKKFYLLTNLLVEESRKGWKWELGIPSTVSLFYKLVLRSGSRHAAGIRDKAFLVELTMQIVRGTISASSGLKTIARQFDIRFPDVTERESMIFLTSVIYENFLRKEPFNYNKGKPLGQLAEELVIMITSIQNIDFDTAFNVIPPCIPILNIYGQISEAYMELRRSIQTGTLFKDGLWPLTLRVLAMPSSDKVFVERMSNTVTRTSATIGQELLKEMQWFAYSPEMWSMRNYTLN
jgi:hypothetical protein